VRSEKLKVEEVKQRCPPDVRERMPTLTRPWQGSSEDSGLVSGRAPAEAALDQVKVFLSFVPFQNPDRNTHRSRLNSAEERRAAFAQGDGVTGQGAGGGEMVRSDW